MSGVPTPPPTTTPAATTGAGSASATANQVSVGEAPLRELPPKLLNLTRPVVLTGTVAGETPDGLTRVRTAVGDVLLKSPTPLPADKPVTLQIPSGSPPERAMVLAQTNPNPPSGGAAAAAGQSAPQSAAATPPGTGNQNPVVVLANANVATPPPTTGPPLTVGGVISALVLAANPKPAAGTAAAPTAGSPRANPAAPQDGGPKGGASGVGGSPPGAAGAATPPTAATGGGPTGAAATLSANTHGQAVELGGDAAHPGTATPQPGTGAPRRGDGTAGDQPPPGRDRSGASPGGGGGSPKTAVTSTALPGEDGGVPGGSGDRLPTTRGPATDAPPKGDGGGKGGQTPAPSPSTGNAGEVARDGATDGVTPKARTGTIGRMALPDMGAARNAPSPPLSNAAPSDTAPGAARTGTVPGGASQGGPTTVTSAGAGAQGAAAPTPATQSGGTPTPNAVAAPTTPATAPPAAPELRTGQTLALKVVSLTTPGEDGGSGARAPSALPAAGAAEGAHDGDGALIRGTVAGTTPQGRPIVATPDGMLALNTTARPPIGSLLTLMVADPNTIGTTGGVGAALPDYLTGKDWPALREVLSALAQMDPALVQSLVQTIIPQPNKKLSAAMSFFIAAMRGGDTRGWLGVDATRALLKGGKEGALLGLEREIGEKAARTADAAPDDWRGYPLPIFDQSGINAMALHIHPFPDPDDPDSTGKGDGKGSRFLLDVELSRLGPLQLDGMVKPPRFDLIMRSRSPLPMELRQELREIFADSLGAVGFEGGLSFQNDARSWVKLARQGSSGPAVTA